MKTIRFLLPLSLMLFWSLSSCVNYYYVVRHAEKETPASDPDTATPLSDDGDDRANVLRDTLRNKNIARIFESQYLRTQQTANPTQAMTGIAPTRYNHTTPPETGAANLVTQLRALTNNVLVVGHSDNIPLIIQQLTGESVTITHLDFDNLFVIKRNRCPNPDRYTLYRRTYGVPTQ